MSGLLIAVAAALLLWLALRLARRLRREVRRERRARRTRPAERAVVCLTSGNCLLVMQAANNPLELPKGRVKPGETPQEAALRECLEESGLRPETLAPLTSIQIRRGKQARPEVWAVFWGELPPHVTVPFEHRVTGKGKDRGRRHVFSLVPLDELDDSILRAPLAEVLPALRTRLAAGHGRGEHVPRHVPEVR